MTGSRERIANDLLDLADINEDGVDATRRGERVRARASRRDKDIGMSAFDAVAEHDEPGWLLNGRLAGLHREAASLLLSNRRLP